MLKVELLRYFQCHSSMQKISPPYFNDTNQHQTLQIFCNGLYKSKSVNWLGLQHVSVCVIFSKNTEEIGIFSNGVTLKMCNISFKVWGRSKQRQTQTDRCRIQGVHASANIEFRWIITIKWSRFTNENLGVVIKYFPRPLVVGEGDIAFR